MARRGGTWMQRWRVPLGFLCAALFFVFAKPRTWTLIVGGSFALLGLLIRAWSAGHIRKNSQLATSGPYAYTRNPLYFGSFILGLGFTIAAAQPLLAVLFIALFLGIYLPVMRVEGADLAKLFGEDYKAYARAVPLFFPSLLPHRDERAGAVKFDASLYMRYREYRAALGVIVALGLLALRPVFLLVLKSVFVR
ncbi:MAG: isoprenylcysteine carboxylmethyltransferase family protein [Pyrinomonadaceae bacterium]